MLSVFWWVRISTVDRVTRSNTSIRSVRYDLASSRTSIEEIPDNLFRSGLCWCGCYRWLVFRFCYPAILTGNNVNSFSFGGHD